ncbi:hypothetical protein PWT90_09469 [Aphanocladium album]|nr:hypothetical protein PWT90_09469 [Aphanocladium album]
MASSVAFAAEPGWSGTIASKDAGLGGTVTVINDTTLSVSQYTLKDASAPALYWWGATTTNLAQGFRINNERVDRPASTDIINIALDAGHKASEFTYVGLWCEKFNANFGQAQLKKDGAPVVSNSTSGDKGGSSGKPGAASGLDAGKMAVVAVINAAAFAAFLLLESDKLAPPSVSGQVSTSLDFVTALPQPVRAELIGFCQDSLKHAWQIFVIFPGVALLMASVEEDLPLRMELDTEFCLEEKKSKGSKSTGANK